MKPKLSQLLAMAPVALVALAPQGARAAAVDYFLKIEGIEGETTDKVHTKEIALSSFSLGVANTAASASGAAAGKAQFANFSVITTISKASPLLYLNTATGTHLKSATFAARKVGPNPTDFYTVKLEDVTIASVQTSGSPADLPTESVSLTYTKITWSYRAQKADGSYDAAVSKGWDVKAAKAL